MYRKSVFATLIILLILCSNINAQITYIVKFNQVNSKIPSINSISLSLETTLNNMGYSIDNNDLRLSVIDNHYEFRSVFAISVPDDLSLDEIYSTLNNKYNLEYIYASANYKIDSFPNDSLASEQWGNIKIGSYELYDSLAQLDDIIVGLIDTGIDDKHVDLTKNIYINSGETGIDINGYDKRFNNIDDDGNGFIDDFRGYDFTDRSYITDLFNDFDFIDPDNDPSDEHGHGTSIAGILAAEINNTIGIAGVSPNIKILNIRAFDKTGSGEEDDVARAILYAVDNGAKVINMSFGDNVYSKLLKDVVHYAKSKGIILVGSAGNSSSSEPHFPSGFSEVISVGSSTREDYVSGFSNFGSSLDLVAPGSGIITTAIGNKYRTINGTSASAPFVAATAAILKSKYNYSPSAIKQIIKTTSSDINTKGWDEKSGAGRLDLTKAFYVNAPSKIEIIHPENTFGTSDDILDIKATVLSSNFQSYDLYLGVGNNPKNWETLITGVNRQVLNKNILQINLASKVDTSYTLRLKLNQTNGRTTEERSIFYLDRSKPTIKFKEIVPVFNLNKKSLLINLVTDDLCEVSINYRLKNTSSFKKIYLDGNESEIKNIHYSHSGLLSDLAEGDYQFFIELSNSSGLISIDDNDGQFYDFENFSIYSQRDIETKSYKLGHGILYKNKVSINTSFQNVIQTKFVDNKIINRNYQFENKLIIHDEKIIDNMLIKVVGDFNNNGKTDILSFLANDGFLLEQESIGSEVFSIMYEDTLQKNFWPCYAGDIDSDGATEVISINKNRDQILIWQLDANLQPVIEAVLLNFSGNHNSVNPSLGNIFNSNNVFVGMIGDSPNNQIWIVDSDGDILTYNIMGQNSYSNGQEITTFFDGNRNKLCSGDFNGDGSLEVALILKSDNEDFLNYNKILILQLQNNNLEIIGDFNLFDKNSDVLTQMNQSVKSSIKLLDIDNDLKDELVIQIFPDTYIFENNILNSLELTYVGSINSLEPINDFSNIFFDDIDLNGINELSIPTEDGINFIEFPNTNRAPTPYNFIGYSLTENSIYLTWNKNNSESTYLYRGFNQDSLSLFDSTTTNSYLDTSVSKETYYHYAIQSVNSGYLIPTSTLLKSNPIYSHNPAIPNPDLIIENKSVKINFNNKIINTANSTSNFMIEEFGNPTSIIPTNDSTYLILFSETIPSGNQKLVINDLLDFYNSPISRDTIPFENEILKSDTSFYITAYRIISPYKIEIEFNLDIDVNSIIDLNNFILSNQNVVVKSEPVNNNKNIVYLHTENPVLAIGKETVIKISNIRSSQNTGYIPIEDGAGSYINLASNEDDLSDVYVYPNPVRASNHTIVFAGLPSQARITVLSIDGTFVNQFDEVDGNGGYEWNLRDNNSKIISSGVYIYIVNIIDESGDLTDEFIGKFILVK